MDLSAITYSVFIPLLFQIKSFLGSIGMAGFGWAIVFLTAVVKLILTPATFKQIKSTKKMQVIQPKIKALQADLKKKEEQYASNPQKLNEARMQMQTKMMNIYKENSINPLGGCVPLIFQMPILLGLFWTFSGTPFKAKPITANIKVVSVAEASKKQVKSASNNEIYVNESGGKARYSLSTKGATIVEGDELSIDINKVMGDANVPAGEIKWLFDLDKEESDVLEVVEADNMHIVLRAKTTGRAKVSAYLPATVHEPFLFVHDFGATGVYNKQKNEINYDVLILVLLFGTSIWLSTALNSPKFDENADMSDPQVMMQKSMSSTMPVMMTIMMLFIPLPAGAFIYMIVSGYIQAGQTYFASKRYETKFAA